MKAKSLCIALGASLLVLFSSCQTEQPEYKSEYVGTVAVDTESNAMRVTVKPEFKQACNWSVRYWKASAKENTALQTVAKESSDVDGQTLLFLSDNTEYNYRFIINGEAETGTHSFQTCKKPSNLMNFETIEKTPGDWVDGYILQTNASEDAYVTLCDYNGDVVWYDVFGKNSNFAWFCPSNGLMAVYGAKDKSLVCTDLTGKIYYRGTSSADFLPNLHHDFRMLDNGNMLALHRVPKNYGGIDYYGEAMTEIDQTGKIVFYWDTFEYYNPEVTPYIKYEPSLKDYLHANSVERDSNGDYYMTLNWLTEIIKIDGKTGKLVYRFGERGDVRMTGETPEVYHSVLSPSSVLPEGSAVHTAIALEPDKILCLANGKDDYISKAAVVTVDPVKKTAHYDLLVDFEKRFNTADRSNVSLLPGNRVLLGSAPLDRIIIANYEGETLRVLERKSGISPRALYYAPEDFSHYLVTK